MIKKIIANKKSELEIKEFILKFLGKGKVSNIAIQRTPIGEKIIIHTSRPGFIVGRGGEGIMRITESLKKRFKLENPRIEIAEVSSPELDAATVADKIALSLERFGHLRFKVIAYRALERMQKAGALGVEIILSGKLPSERTRSWRFSYGYLKKTGETSKITKKAITTAKTIPGIIGVKVAIVPPGVELPDSFADKTIHVEEIKEKKEKKEKEIKKEKEEVKQKAKPKKKKERGEKKKAKKKTKEGKKKEIKPEEVKK